MPTHCPNIKMSQCMWEAGIKHSALLDYCSKKHVETLYANQRIKKDFLACMCR